MFGLWLHSICACVCVYTCAGARVCVCSHQWSKVTEKINTEVCNGVMNHLMTLKRSGEFSFCMAKRCS